MSLIPVWHLDAEDLRSLGITAPAAVIWEQTDPLRQWRGVRRPDGFTSSIRCFLKTNRIRSALVQVLDSISQVSFEDAPELQELVWAVVPLLKPDYDLAPVKPRWLDRLKQMPSPGGPLVEKQGLLGAVQLCCPSKCPGCRLGGQVVIYVRDEEMDFDAACWVLAHECGHVLYRGEWCSLGQHGHFMRSDAWVEPVADQTARRWGFARQEKLFKAYCQRLRAATAAATTGPDGDSTDKGQEVGLEAGREAGVL